MCMCRVDKAHNCYFPHMVKKLQANVNIMLYFVHGHTNVTLYTVVIIMRCPSGELAHTKPSHCIYTVLVFVGWWTGEAFVKLSNLFYCVMLCRHGYELWLCVCLSACHKSVFYQKEWADQASVCLGIEASFNPSVSYTVIRESRYLQKYGYFPLAATIL